MSFPYSWWPDDDLDMHRRTIELALSFYPSGQSYAAAALRSQLDDVDREIERRRSAADSVKPPAP